MYNVESLFNPIDKDIVDFNEACNKARSLSIARKDTPYFVVKAGTGDIRVGFRNGVKLP